MIHAIIIDNTWSQSGCDRGYSCDFLDLPQICWNLLARVNSSIAIDITFLQSSCDGGFTNHSVVFVTNHSVVFVYSFISFVSSSSISVLSPYHLQQYITLTSTEYLNDKGDLLIINCCDGLNKC